MRKVLIISSLFVSTQSCLCLAKCLLPTLAPLPGMGQKGMRAPDQPLGPSEAGSEDFVGTGSGGGAEGGGGGEGTAIWLY
ncbi:unnamed protein product, partial [Mesorhabditis belari]|uniref:Secreted protein n=1 Tax=Mesorhabditis belari TaxID=2138241 RepID=A0AAF3EG10_9BILA